jgi:O-antigen/teichoic acid export membrane protein
MESINQNEQKFLIFKAKLLDFFKNEQKLFTISALIVNAINYLYNLVLGRTLGPVSFAETALFITFLLILSFIGTTFQMFTTKFRILVEEHEQKAFYNFSVQASLFIGVFVGFVFILYSPIIQDFFHTTHLESIQIFGLGIPFYFLLSVQRGFYQGDFKFKRLAFSYQIEVLIKFFGSMFLILFTDLHFSFSIAISILISLILANFAFVFPKIQFHIEYDFWTRHKTKIIQFASVTLIYELTQILINNGDILMVKRFFENEEAGLYSCLALFGRIVFFVSWIMIMTFMPTVIQKNKEGKSTLGLLLSQMMKIGIICIIMFGASLLFPSLIVTILFGKSFSPVSHLLPLYVLATSLFALSNVIVYYNLSLSQYLSVFIALIIGIVQIIAMFYIHNSLANIIWIQILLNGLMFLFLILYQYFRK